MPRVIPQEKAQKLAEEYVTNGFCKEKALLATGYTPAYSRTTKAGLVFETPVVKKEIDRIMSRSAEICSVEVEEIVRGLRLKAFPPEGHKVRDSDNLRALELLGKFKLMFAERLMLGVENPQQRELDESQKEECKKIAAIRLHQSIG